MANVLVACEYSGIVREAFAKLGHNAWSCDLLDTEQPGNHIVGDVLEIINDPWDLIIAHPPCTYLCNSGVRWLYLPNGNLDLRRWDNLMLAVDFFNAIKNNPCPRICIENPIPHKHASIGNYSQKIQPWQFGHKETKATCLWLKGLPNLVPTSNLKSEALPVVHYESPSPDRWKNRSRTRQGIADAMANQWSKLLA